jgi:hypothetical protein
MKLEFGNRQPIEDYKNTIREKRLKEIKIDYREVCPECDGPLTPTDVYYDEEEDTEIVCWTCLNTTECAEGDDEVECDCTYEEEIPLSMTKFVDKNQLVMNF